MWERFDSSISDIILKYMLLRFWLWFGLKFIGFDYVDSPNKEEVLGITFSVSEEYINKVQNIK
jgi:hypothetical protein